VHNGFQFITGAPDDPAKKAEETKFKALAEAWGL